MIKLKITDIYYIIPIIITTYGFFINLVPLSKSNALLFLGIDVLLVITWKQISFLTRIESFLKKKIFIDRDDLPNLKERINRAKKSIWVMAQSHARLVGVDFGILEKKYNEGCDIRILLLNPDAIKNKMMSNWTEDDLRRQIDTSINILKNYKGKSQNGGCIESRLLPFEPGFGLFIIDGESQDGEIKIEFMLKGITPMEWPNHIIRRDEDSRRYDQFLKHFVKIWDISDPIL